MPYTEWKSNSVEGGSYRARVQYSYTDSSISWNYEIEITSAFNVKLYASWHNMTTGARGGLNTAYKEKGTHTPADWKTFTGGETFTLRIGMSNEHAGDLRGYVTFTIPASTQAPASPTYVNATKINDARISISVSGTSYTTRPAQSITLERSEDGGSWSSVGSAQSVTGQSSWSASWDDTDVEAGHSYQYRAKATSSSRPDSEYRYSSTVYTTPKTDQDVNVSITGTTATITWSVDNVGDIDKGIIQGWYVEKSTNGGSYQRIGQVRASTSQYNYSYVTSVAEGYNYDFRVVAYGAGGTSYEGGGSGSSTTAPSAPRSVTAYRNENDNVVITITDSPSNTAEDVLIERSIDGGTWTQIASEDFPLDTYLDETALASDSLKYRVRNKNGSGYSGYTESATVSVKSKPNAPSLLTPINSAVVDIGQGTVRLIWRHNSTDGSPQRQAELQYKIDSGSWVTLTFTNEGYYDLSLSGMSANNVITWRARTKGSHADWSDYSLQYAFTLLQKPEIHIISPVNAEVITNLPVYVQYSYSDYSGTLQELEIDIIKNNEVVQTFVDEEKTGEYSLAGFLFDNDSVYGIRVRALSSSGLRADFMISITIQYESSVIEGGLLLAIVNDEEEGIANVIIARDITDDVDPVDIDYAILYRVSDGEREFLGEVQEGEQVADLLAPINVEYQYELMQITEDGDLSLMRYSNSISSHYSFIYFGDEVFRGKWNQIFKPTLKRPERVEKRYSGRKYPVSYDSVAIGETCNYSTVLVNRDELIHLKSLMRKGNGQGVWKSADGDAYFANFEISYSTNRFHIPSSQAWDVELSVTRIEE